MQCQLPAVLPSTGVLAVSTLQSTTHSSVQVGYKFGPSGHDEAWSDGDRRGGDDATTTVLTGPPPAAAPAVGFATVPPSLAGGMANYNRTDIAPLSAGVVVPGGALELRVFVDVRHVTPLFAWTLCAACELDLCTYVCMYVLNQNLACGVGRAIASRPTLVVERQQSRL